ncbi:acetolactate synthase small subunit [Buchnera aphidicola (Periphyllus koelreuteriae)]|uniref:acetolactate synthase small subunit n=1 Tax=Buchnera aphidicola TaxID=9 RepID=UPI0031B7FC25
MIKKNLLILLENQSDVLSRIINIFFKTGYQIKNISISKQKKDKTLSYMNIQVLGKKKFIPQIIKQLYKLIDVLKITILNKKKYIEREILLIKIKIKKKNIEKIKILIKKFKIKIVSIYKKKYILQIVNKKSKIQKLLKIIQTIGNIIKISRSGLIAISRIKKFKHN